VSVEIQPALGERTLSRTLRAGVRNPRNPGRRLGLLSRAPSGLPVGHRPGWSAPFLR